MKLPDFTNNPEMLELRRLMGASAPGNFSLTYRPKALTEEELSQLAVDGIEVTFDKITKLDDGTLAYKDSRVLVYIRDVPVYDDFNLPRFHVAYCKTLEDMRNANRFDRYVVATREDGLFWIYKILDGRRHEGSWERLRVCQNCLSALQYDGFSYSLAKSHRLKIVQQFEIARFFQKFPKSLHLRRPNHNYISAPINDYTADFRQISRRIKQARGYKCENCGLSPGSQHLHVHHINGQKNDNNDTNLRVLCRRCHANMPHHEHMKRDPGFDEFQRKYDPAKS